MIKFLFKYFISLYKMYRIEKDFAKEIDSIVNSLKLPSSSSPNTFSPIISSSAFL